MHTTYATGVDFTTDGTNSSGSPSLDLIGEQLSSEGRRPTEYRMNGRMAKALSTAIFKNSADASYVLVDGKILATQPNLAAGIAHYIDKASGGHAVQVVAGAGIPDGEVRVKSTELDER